MASVTVEELSRIDAVIAELRDKRNDAITNVDREFYMVRINSWLDFRNVATKR
jgi:hypothetical protein